MIRRWYDANIEMLRRLYGAISYDEQSFSWIKIHNFKLPPFYNQIYTSLLITTPCENIENYSSYDFYINKGLKRKGSRAVNHIFDEAGYNNLSHKNYARLSLHLDSFKPSLDLINGENIVDICQVVYNHLAQKKGI